MDSFNLAIVIGPTLLPAEEKLPSNPAHRLNKTCELFKLLIDNASQIGVLSEYIIERIAMVGSTCSLNADEDAVSLKKKKKRRSGSLTRMLSGLKKIVSNKSEDDQHAPMPDVLMTPCITHSAKKRKMEGLGLSNKKRREILKTMPQNAILNTPFAPASTPVSTHPNINKAISPTLTQKPKTESTKDKLMLWSSRTKSKKQNDETSSLKSTGSNSLQRRWSAVSSAAGFKRKKLRNSCSGALTSQKNKIAEKDPQIDNRINDLSEELIKKVDDTSENYVRISKVEYEEIKNRVSAIERRISIELEHVQEDGEDVNKANKNCVDEVEKAYEQTLVQAEALSNTTDQLAKRLSRELKIRRSDEHKVFRSPSARKIGSLRRRSREGVRLSRNQTWCVTSTTPKSSLRRGKPNTVQTGLPQPPPGLPDENSSKDEFTRSYSTSVISSGSSTKWESAMSFIDSSAQSHAGTPVQAIPTLDNCRASLARLRSQNVGMVMAKARLFDNMVDGDAGESNDAVPVQMVRTKTECRPIGRVRALRAEERRIGKKSMSPRKRGFRAPVGGRLQKAQFTKVQSSDVSSFEDGDIICNTTPKSVPIIRKSLNPKTPRRICRTPVSDGRTPLKVIAHIKY